MAARDDDGFSAFVAGNGGRLRRTAYLLCGDWQRAGDITQEALIRLYVAWPRLDKGGLPTYARRALVSAATDVVRKRSSSEVVAEPNETMSSADDIERMAAKRAALLAALAELPLRQRACVVLRYFEELSVAETAAALDCSEGTVKSQTARALDSLKSTIRAQLGDDLVVAEDVGGLPW